MLMVNYGDIGGKLFPIVLLMICLLLQSMILTMSVRSLLGHWLGEGVVLSFLIDLFG